MKPKIFVLLLAIIFTTFFISSDAKPIKANTKVYKLIYQTGINSLAYLPSLDIIPSLEPMMPIVPDSVWEDLKKMFDTTKVLAELADRVSREFNEKELDCISILIDSVLDKIEMRIDTSNLLNFQKLTMFFSILDSLPKILENSLKLKLEFDVNNGSAESRFDEEDSTQDTLKTKSNERSPKTKRSPESESFLQSLRLNKQIWEKAVKEMFSAQKELLKSLNALLKYYLETNKDLFKEFLLQEQRFRQRQQRLRPKKQLDSASRELLKLYEEENKKLLKEFQEQKDKLLKELENLNKEMKKQSKEYYEKNRQEKPIGTVKEKIEGSCFDKELFNKARKFFYGLLNLRKEYDSKILNELKRRGYLVE